MSFAYFGLILCVYNTEYLCTICDIYNFDTMLYNKREDKDGKNKKTR